MKIHYFWKVFSCPIPVHYTIWLYFMAQTPIPKSRGRDTHELSGLTPMVPKIRFDKLQKGPPITMSCVVCWAFLFTQKLNRSNSLGWLPQRGARVLCCYIDRCLFLITGIRLYTLNSPEIRHRDLCGSEYEQVVPIKSEVKVHDENSMLQSVRSLLSTGFSDIVWNVICRPTLLS